MLLGVSRRLLVGIIIAGIAALLLAWVLRRPLLLNTLRDEITAALGNAMQADVRCSRISGDPFGTVILDGVTIGGGAGTIEIDGGKLSIDVDPVAVTHGSPLDVVRKAHLHARHVILRTHAGGLQTTDAARPDAAAVASQPSRMVLCPDGLAFSAESFTFADMDLECANVAITLVETVLTSNHSGVELRGTWKATAVHWRDLRIGDVTADVVWKNRELSLSTLQVRGIKSSAASADCHATGTARIDLPRGSARTVARIHWDVAGELTPSAISFLESYLPAIAPAKFRSTASIKLPIQYGQEEEYIAGKLRIDIDGMKWPGMIRTVEVRADSEIDGLGLLVFKDVRLRSAAHDLVEVRGRYPLHHYGRPDVRVSVDVPNLEPWTNAIFGDAAVRGAVRSTLRIRGEKSDPQIRWQSGATVTVDVAAIRERFPGYWVTAPAIHRALTHTPLDCAIEVRGRASGLTVRRAHLDSRHLRIVGAGDLPIALQPGLSWGETLMSLSPRPAQSGLQLLGTWNDANRALSFRVRWQHGEFEIEETRRTNVGVIGSSSLR